MDLIQKKKKNEKKMKVPKKENIQWKQVWTLSIMPQVEQVKPTAVITKHSKTWLTYNYNYNGNTLYEF